ncbi:MAG: ATP-binding protein [Syntrophales bacterium]|nr:ATP-binding protein [Syntrophales bacterium]
MNETNGSKMHLEFPVQGGNFSGAGGASSRIKNVLKQLGIQYDTIKRVAIASYESEMNIVAYATKGKLLVDIEPGEIAITAVDIGPGIPDIEKALQEGYSTATPLIREMGFGAGLGLPNIKKAADEMVIESVVGEGTTVKMKFRLL